MNKIIFSTLTIIVAALAVVGGTGAFFSDTEEASGNTFAAGIIDLKVDNESYYNGAISEETTWMEPADLDDGRLFFNFNDVKPDDEGEDTISLHVGTNDAWVCMDVSLTSDDDVSSTEPELDGTGDVEEDINDTWDGELADNLQFVWWADDGDNVLEEGENIISDGVQTLKDLAYTNGAFTVALADSENNVWGEPEGTPIPANETHYIAKAWCFGTLTTDPLANDSDEGPFDDENNPRGTGVLCDGTALGNETQTDSATLDVTFRAFQARHVNDFLCSDGDPRLAKITVVKVVQNDDGGNNVVSDFQLFVDNGTVITNVTSGIPTMVAPGNYTVNEDGSPGYVASFSGDCDQYGQITLNDGDDKTCVITNDDLPANITLFKNVINDNGGTAGPTQFGLTLDGNLVMHNSSVSVLPNTPHSIGENGRAGYHFVSITGTSSYGKPCPDVLNGTITLDEGETIVCTITNDDD
jgi:predicted ribosomally synthesized peptide with SipW-like signal peptide